MAKEERFLVVKTNDSKEIKYFEYDKLQGYNIKPKNNVKFLDAINVNKMILINPSLIQKMIDKKIKKRFDYLINLLSIVIDNANETGDGEGLYLALDEAERLRMEILNKYRRYMEEEKLELLLKKIDILENELKLRIKYIEYANDEYYMEGKSR